jgi:hypothetical protein
MGPGAMRRDVPPAGVTSFDVFERVADGLDLPNPARMALGLPHPHRATPSDRHLHSSRRGHPVSGWDAYKLPA